MINTINYIVSKLPCIAVMNAIKTDTIFSLRINNISDIQKINLQEIYSLPYVINTSCYFSLYIDFFDKEFIVNNQDLKDCLLQFFFHVRFKKNNNKPIIFINNIDCKNEEITTFLFEMDSFCKSSGFEGIELVYFKRMLTDISPQTTVDIYNFDNQLNISNIYFDLIFLKFYVANIFCINNIQEECIIDTSYALIDAEKRLSKESEPQYKLMKSFNEIIKKKYLLENQLILITSDLENQKQYVNFLKAKDDTLKINEFYQNEYEILPLWYKKLGHLIKVILGKRNFRSLYDNNVKKYKN